MKVLHVLNGLNVGGAEAFLMNLRKAMQDDDVQMDFLLRSRTNEAATIRFFEERGSEIFYMPSFPRDVVANYVQTKRFFKEHKNTYDVVHVHANSLFYYLPIRLARHLCKNTRVVVHSHNAAASAPLAARVHSWNRMRLRKQYVMRVACSKVAGDWMFGKEVAYRVVNNAIDLARYNTGGGTSEIMLPGNG